MNEILITPVTLVFIVLTVIGLTVFIIVAKTGTSEDPAKGEKAGKAKKKDSSPSETYLEHIRLGNDAMTQSQWETALTHFSQAIKIRNNDETVHFKLGRIFAQKEDFPNALAAFRNVLALNEHYLEAYFESARIYKDQGKTDLAIEQLDSLLQRNPDHEAALKLKAKWQMAQEDYQQALLTLDKLFAVLTPDSPNAGPNASVFVEYRMIYVDCLLKLGHPAKAIEILEAMIPQAPKSENAIRHRLGELYYDLSNYAQAIEQFRLLLTSQHLKEAERTAIKTHLAAALCNEGVRMFEAARYDQAILYYNEALVEDPSNCDILFNLGKAQALCGNSHAAIEFFEKALAVNPNDASICFEIAAIHDQHGQDKQAIRFYEACLQKDPHYKKAAAGLGTLYGVVGQFPQAIKYLSMAVQDEPDNIDSIYNLAVAYEKQSNRQKAQQLYQKVLLLDPNHVEARSNLFHLQREMKKA
jgi:tetratricopeptide (TPR) repeat protein